MSTLTQAKIAEDVNEFCSYCTENNRVGIATPDCPNCDLQQSTYCPPMSFEDLWDDGVPFIDDPTDQVLDNIVEIDSWRT